MIATYANAGPGIFFLIVLIVVGIICVIWIAGWIPHGFRATSPRRPTSSARWIFHLLTVAAIMLCFPPLRQAGVWHHTETNQPIPAASSIEYDRFYFGYIPSYRWIGKCFVTDIPDASTTISLSEIDTYRLSGIKWVIDWWFLIPQLIIACLFLLPFIRAISATKPPNKSLHPTAATSSVMESQLGGG